MTLITTGNADDEKIGEWRQLNAFFVYNKCGYTVKVLLYSIDESVSMSAIVLTYALCHLKMDPSGVERFLAACV
jgi:hypothetical protein